MFGEDGKVLKVEGVWLLVIVKIEFKIFKEGIGEKVDKNVIFKVNYVGVNGCIGKEFDFFYKCGIMVDFLLV